MPIQLVSLQKKTVRQYYRPCAHMYNSSKKRIMKNNTMKAKTTNYCMVAKKRRKTKKKKLGAWSLHTFFCSFEILKLQEKKMDFSLINCFSFFTMNVTFTTSSFILLCLLKTVHIRDLTNISLFSKLFFLICLVVAVSITLLSFISSFFISHFLRLTEVKPHV